VGKTRLALELARSCHDHFADGVGFLPLAALCTPAMVTDAIAGAVGVELGDEFDEPPLLPVTAASLRDRQLLLVLDNVEHLLPDAAGVVVELLAACPRLALLTTSRGPIHVRGERILPVPPLAVPDARSLESLPELAATPSVAVFVASARAVRPDFELTPENADDVAAVCQRLEGLPLALELAAARIRALSPRALLARLEPRLPALTGGARDLPERHRSLRATLAWSYELLAPRDQALFRRLCLFERGATLGAALAVWRAEPAACGVETDLDVLDGLAALADHGLLLVEELATTEPRIAMLETIREYGCELLRAAGEQDASARACTEYYLGLMEAGECARSEAEPASWPLPGGAIARPPECTRGSEDVRGGAAPSAATERAVDAVPFSRSVATSAARRPHAAGSGALPAAGRGPRHSQQRPGAPLAARSAWSSPPDWSG
jgi:predicted ATPase